MEQINPAPKKTRKFKAFEYYQSSKQNEYYLLPFKFHRINEHKEVFVNEVGDFLIVPSGTAEKVITRKLNPEIEKEVYADLVANFFISEDQIPALIDIAAVRYRTKKSFLEGFTTLHIFVISLRCEHTCHYCQVSRVTTNKTAYDMSTKHIDKGIEYMMMSPSVNLTMEFQGGEALLAFENIKYAIEKANMLAQKLNKNMTYVICTNLALLNEEILNYCKTENILISASLDGPDFIHNANRHRPGNNSYELTIEGIEKCRASIGEDKVSALLTATTLSLDYPTEIVDEYFNKNFKSIFLRPISPYGFAKHNDKKNGYLTDRSAM